jgi:hypothetical protein
MIIAAAHPLVLTVSHDWPTATPFAMRVLPEPSPSTCPKADMHDPREGRGSSAKRR